MSDSEYPSVPHRRAKGKKGKRSGHGQSSQMEFMKGAHNFRVNDVNVRHTEGDYHDHSVKNTHNDFSSHVRNEYDQSNSRAPIFNGNIHGPVNNYNHGIVVSKPRRGDKGEFDTPGDAQQKRQQQSFRSKRDEDGNFIRVFDQSYSHAPLYNGNIGREVNNHDHSISLEGYDELPENLPQVIEAHHKGLLAKITNQLRLLEIGALTRLLHLGMVAQGTANSLARRCRCMLSLLRTINLTTRQQIRGLVRGMAIPAERTQRLILTSLARDITQILDTSISSNRLHMATSPTMGART
ncbi:hypothetical protein EST38_g11236 [Candolleomyces aberdarensis]|uniref:Uncharacterized protein n=1 Tax=Candolleomyces aberdarensis TaxID=2316362 RepID=A0A4V1Q2C6_9AGAR|nr:hypothetical protein EST38_g11236 [Candolleomyces aberdarensis]